MMNTPAMKALYKASLWISAIVALHKGLEGLGIDLVPRLLSQMNLMWLAQPLYIIFGIAGVISILGLLTEMKK